MRLIIWISYLNIANSHCFQSTSNPANIQFVLEIVVILEQGFVVVHMVRCTIVFDPDSLHSPHSWVECCLEAECEAAEDRVVRGNGVIVVIGISEIRCSTASAASMAFSTSPPSAVTAALLSFASLLCIVLVCDMFVAFLLRMIAVATVGAWG